MVRTHKGASAAAAIRDLHAAMAATVDKGPHNIIHTANNENWSPSSSSCVIVTFVSHHGRGAKRRWRAAQHRDLRIKAILIAITTRGLTPHRLTKIGGFIVYVLEDAFDQFVFG